MLSSVTKNFHFVWWLGIEMAWDENFASSLVNNRGTFLMYGAHSVSTEQQQMLLFLVVDSALRIIKISWKTIYFQLEISYEDKTGHSNRIMRGLHTSHSTTACFTQNQITRIDWSVISQELDPNEDGEYLHKRYVTVVVRFWLFRN